MIKKSSVIVLPILIAVALTGCGGSPKVTPTALPTSQTVDDTAQKVAAEKAEAERQAAEAAAAEKAEADRKAAEIAAQQAAPVPPPVAAPPVAQNDPKFSTCKEALASGYGNYTKADPEYIWYQDKDGDGKVCEKK